MLARVIRYSSPKEATVHNQLLMFSTEREFRKKLRLEDVPSLGLLEVFRIWALCFRDELQVCKGERISIERFLYAADFSAVRWQHEYECKYQRLNSVSEVEERGKVLWYWMIAVARRIFCKRYKGFLDEMLEKLASREFCVNLTTWNPEWMGEIRNGWSE